MLAPGAYARARGRCPIAIDLGTLNVRIWLAGHDTLVAPTVVARASAGRYLAAGRDALDLAERTGTPLVWPVRDGVIADLPACAYLLRSMLGAGPDPKPSPVLVGVPATATLMQRNMLIATAGRATGGRVSWVEEPLAASLACGPSLDADDELVTVDIGHGRTEVVQVHGGEVLAALRVDTVNHVDQVPAIARAVRGLAGPPRRRGRRRLLVTGGGAATVGVAGRLAALTGRSVTVPENPWLATIRGLGLLLTA
ncbi:rod shape-determining protein [Polymorphospora sp. NPDC051019]|uniref:rod shape-determining protein n=1 Tax=Polymorphospora sp. NPDC051019 TaxID=3155725 RepID=UPI003446D824